MRVKQSRFTLLLIGCIAISAVILTIGLVFWQQQQSATNKLAQAYQAKKSECDKVSQDLLHRDGAIADLTAINSRLAVLGRNLTDYEYVPTYLREIQATAARTGNMIRTIQPGEIKPLDLSNSQFADKTDVPAGGQQTTAAPTAPAQSKPTGPQYQVMSINLDVSGTYVSILKLLNEFRRFPKMIYVKTVTLAPVKSGEGVSGAVTAQVQTYAIITPDQYKIDNGTTSVKKDGSNE